MADVRGVVNQLHLIFFLVNFPATKTVESKHNLTKNKNFKFMQDMYTTRLKSKCDNNVLFIRNFNVFISRTKL